MYKFACHWFFAFKTTHITTYQRFQGVDALAIGVAVWFYTLPRRRRHRSLLITINWLATHSADASFRKIAYAAWMSSGVVMSSFTFAHFARRQCVELNRSLLWSDYRWRCHLLWVLMAKAFVLCVETPSHTHKDTINTCSAIIFVGNCAWWCAASCLAFLFVCDNPISRKYIRF